MIAALAERKGKAGAGFCITAIERDGAPRQLLFRALCFGGIAHPESYAGSAERGAEARVAAGEEWIEVDGLLKEFFSNRVIRSVALGEMPQAALISPPGVEACRRLPHRPLAFGIGDGRGNGGRHRLGDLVLHRKDFGEVAIVALGPDVVAGPDL